MHTYIHVYKCLFSIKGLRMKTFVNLINFIAVGSKALLTTKRVFVSECGKNATKLR